MDSTFEYYVISWSNDEDIPNLDEHDDCPGYFYVRGPIENPELMTFQFGDPVPRKPKMTDYLSSPNSIVSKKIYNVLQPLKITGIQLLPALIYGKKNEIFDNYWAIHIYNVIKGVDAKLSKCTIGRVQLDDVEKIILDRKTLCKIPLDKRLIFVLQEDTSYQLFHVSVMNAIMSVQPTGVRFINIEDWNEESLFED